MDVVRLPRYSALIIALVAGLALTGCSKDEASAIAKAKARMEKRDAAGAEIELKTVIQKFPKSGEARYLLGMQLLKRYDIVNAAIELRRARELRYDDNLVAPALARAIMMNNKPAELISSFGQLQLSDAKAHAEVQAMLAQAHAREGDPGQARAVLDAALARQPDSVTLQVAKVQLEAIRGDAKVALASADALVGKYPNSEEAWSLKGDMTVRGGGTPAAAMEAYRKALSIKPDLAHARSSLVALLLQAGQVDDAAKELDELKKNAETQFATGLLDAYVAVGKKDFGRARNVFQALLKAAPDHPLLLAGAAENELRLNDLAQAEAFAAKALSAAPGNVQARRVMGQALLRKGEPDKALRVLAPLVERPEASPELLALAAQAETMSGNAQGAELLYQRMAKLKVSDPRLRTLVATAGGRNNTEAMIAQLQDISASDTGISADMAIINARLKAKDFAGALAAVDAIERKQPRLPLAPYLSSVVLAYKRDLPAARKALETALSRDDTYLPAVSGLAALDLSEKKPEQAKERFNALLKKQPNNPAVHLALAELARRSGAAPAEIQKLVEQAVKAAPQDNDARQSLINLHLMQGDARNALTVATAGLALSPNSVEALDRVGRLHAMLGDNDQAQSAFGKIISQHPDAAVGHLGLARLNLGPAGNPTQAQRSAEKVLEFDPKNVEAMTLLAAAQTRRKDFEGALKTARRLQDTHRMLPTGLLVEAEVEAAQNHWDASAVALRAALDKPASGAPVAPKLHQTLVRAGKTTEAEAFATGWLQKNPKDIVFLAYWAEAAERSGNLALAEKRYRDLVAVAPNHAIGLNNLAMLLIKQKKPAGAQALVEAALKAAPAEPAFMDTLAEVHAMEGRLDKAIELQTKVVERAGKEPMYRLKLAEFQLQAGAKKAAKAELDRLAAAQLQMSDNQRKAFQDLQDRLTR